VLKDGKSIKADAVVLATGYSSSWTKIFDREHGALLKTDLTQLTH
jgi:lysine/ornithine N-monooxygenase